MAEDADEDLSEGTHNVDTIQISHYFVLFEFVDRYATMTRLGLYLTHEDSLSFLVQYRTKKEMGFVTL